MKTPIIDVLEAKPQELRRVATIAPSATVGEAVRLMNERRIGAVLVTRDAVVEGIFTERDVLTRVVAAERDPRATSVAEVMTSEIHTLAPDTTVEGAMGVMTETRCRHMPVISDGRLVGLVSIGDLTRWLVRHQRIHLRELVRYVAGSPAVAAG